MRRDESAVGLGRNVVKGFLRDDATVPTQIRRSAGWFQLEHLDGLAAAVADHIDLHSATSSLQERDSMRPEGIADRTRACRIAPILARFRADGQSGERSLGGIEQHEAGNSCAGRSAHKLTD